MLTLETMEIVAVVFAVAYLAFTIRQNIWCWPAALVSVTLFSVIYFDARLYMQSGLQVYYFGMAIFGWFEWQRGGKEHSGVKVHWWPPLIHVAVIALIFVASAVSSWIWVRTGVDSAFPFLDSFTTIAALVTAFMVATKVIENWIYWFVIDVLLVYLSWQSGLPWMAGLYALYLVMVVMGFIAWLKSSRADAGKSSEPATA